MSDFNVPIHGDINKGYRREVPQRSALELQIILNEAWAAGVTGVVWQQYTPYFNDGETCIFGASSEGVYSVSELSEDDLEGPPIWGDVEDSDSWLIENEYSYQKNPDGTYARDEFKQLIKVYHDSTPQGIAANKVAAAINSGAFENVLLDNFGDPATVVATPTAFHVVYLEHD